MSETQFLVILIILGIIYGFENKVTAFLNKKFFKNSDFKLNSVYMSYILALILALTLVFGMLLGTKTKKTFKNVSQGFEKIRAKDDGRPHPMFDIDTYW